MFAFCLDNTADAWQKELMSLAQQVQGTLKPSDEPARGRLSRQSLSPSRQQHGSIANSQSDEQFITKRFLNRHVYTARSPSPSAKSDTVNEKGILEPPLNGEHQDHGIWVSRHHSIRCVPADVCCFSCCRFCAISFTSRRFLKLKNGLFVPIQPVRLRKLSSRDEPSFASL